MLLDFQAAYYFSKSRGQDDDWWPMIRKNVEFNLSRTGGRTRWKSQGRNMLDDEFVASVESKFTIQ